MDRPLLTDSDPDTAWSVNFTEPVPLLPLDNPSEGVPGSMLSYTGQIQIHQQKSCSSKLLRRLRQNALAIKNILFTFFVWLIFTVLYCVFVYYILLNGVVEVGTARFDASTANLLVSIFSQIFVILADMVVRGLLSALRLALATNGDASLITFLGISSSTDWFSVLKILCRSWFPCLWSEFTYSLVGGGLLLIGRLGIPIMGLAFGSVLKCLLSP